MLKKVFITLITIVCLIVVGATIINIFLPNTVTQLSSVVEDSIYKGTGMKFDFNGDGQTGDANANNTYDDTTQGGSYQDELSGVDVEGFQ